MPSPPLNLKWLLTAPCPSNPSPTTKARAFLPEPWFWCKITRLVQVMACGIARAARRNLALGRARQVLEVVTGVKTPTRIRRTGRGRARGAAAQIGLDVADV